MTKPSSIHEKLNAVHVGALLERFDQMCRLAHNLCDEITRRAAHVERAVNAVHSALEDEGLAALAPNEEWFGAERYAFCARLTEMLPAMGVPSLPGLDFDPDDEECMYRTEHSGGGAAEDETLAAMYAQAGVTTAKKATTHLFDEPRVFDQVATWAEREGLLGEASAKTVSSAWREARSAIYGLRYTLEGIAARADRIDVTNSSLDTVLAWAFAEGLIDGATHNAIGQLTIMPTSFQGT